MSKSILEISTKEKKNKSYINSVKLKIQSNLFDYILNIFYKTKYR